MKYSQGWSLCCSVPCVLSNKLLGLVDETASLKVIVCQPVHSLFHEMFCLT